MGQVSHRAQSAEQSYRGLRSFYIVTGSPRIRYRRERLQGPLIFHVDRSEEQTETAVQHAMTVDLTAAVPYMESFELSPVIPNDPASGYVFRVPLALTAPADRVQVLAGVRVRYIPGSGIELEAAEATQPCYVVLDAAHVEGPEVQTSVLLWPAQLARATYDAEAQGRRLRTVPLAVVVWPARGESGGGSVAAKSGATPPPPGQASPSSSSSNNAKGMTQAALLLEEYVQSSPVVQYTFLDLPSEDDSRAREGGGAAVGMPGTVRATMCQQLLQIGPEVYELENLFDVGAQEDVDTPGEDEGDVCVICMTNANNTTLMPCRHKCVCDQCAAQLRLSMNRCPICRAVIQRTMTL